MYAILAECPSCEPSLSDRLQVFTPVGVYRADTAIMDPPLERWRCAECQVTLRASALGDIVELTPKKGE